MKRLVIFSLVVVPLFCTTGCAFLVLGAGAGAGVVAFAQGELRSTERNSLDRLQVATVESLAEMAFKVTELKRTEENAEIHAVGANDMRAKVYLRRIDARETHVTIRFGIVGHEEYSRLLLEKIQRRVGKK